MCALVRQPGISGKWFLYILECNDGTLYTGITNDLARRLDQHNRGTASRYTRSRLPARMIYQERCRNRSFALKKELKVKSLTRKEKLSYIAGHISLPGLPARKRRGKRRP